MVPLRVSVPVPILVSASVPEVLTIGPEKVLVALLSPTVKVGVPLTPLSTVPLPERPLMVSLLPPMFKVPLSATLPAVLPFGICSTPLPLSTRIVLVPIVVFP